jgi:hypothetical protein
LKSILLIEDDPKFYAMFPYDLISQLCQLWLVWETIMVQTDGLNLGQTQNHLAQMNETEHVYLVVV